MSSFKSTLISYDRYLDYELFSEMVMPEGIDTDLLKDVIMKECGEMQPLWTDPLYMQHSIGVWSHKYVRTFEKWLAAYNAEYNPIYNYDRFEEVEETKTDSSNMELSGTTSDTLSQTISETGSEEIEDSRNTTRSGTDQSTRTDNLTQTDNLTRTDDLTSKTLGETTASSTESLASETINTRTAYDSNTYQPHDKTNVTNSSQSSSTGGSDTTVKDTGTVKNTGTVTNTGTVGTSGTNSETVTDGYTSGKETDRSITRGDTASGTISNESSEESSGSFGRSAHLYGNIGVTTTQQMLEAEYSISKWNIYENIKDLFMQEFCIMIY